MTLLTAEHTAPAACSAALKVRWLTAVSPSSWPMEAGESGMAAQRCSSV
jgi:hypothetical protein